MKQLPIIAENNPLLTCIERPLFAFAKWKDREYRLTYLSSFNFSYNYVKTYNKLQQVPELLDMLHMYTWATNINVFINETDNLNKLNEIFLREIRSNLPVMTFIDSYHCPWYPSYHTSHVKHYVLIIGVDMQKNEYLCIDRCDCTSYVTLPFRDYESGKGEYIIFRPQNNTHHNSFEVKNMLYKHFNKIVNEYDIKKNIYMFQEQLNSSFSIHEELSNVHSYKVAPIYTWLKGVANSRLKFKIGLEYCENKHYFSVPQKIYTYLDNAYKKWWKVLLLVIKAKDSQNPNCEYNSVIKSLNQICQIESGIIDYVLEIM